MTSPCWHADRAAWGCKRRTAKNLLKFGAVTVNAQVTRKFDYPLAVGDVVVVGGEESAAAAGRTGFRPHQGGVRRRLALMVLDKPAGLLTVATADDKTDTLLFRLNQYLQARDADHPERAFVVHRIDRETSGLVLFAKTEEVRAAGGLAEHRKGVPGDCRRAAGT